MSHPQVLEYKCPCCGAALPFSQDVQKMQCSYCDTVFALEAVKAFNEDQVPREDQWQEPAASAWSDAEQACVTAYRCNSCGGELITDHQTAATFCPYCGNPTVIPGRLAGAVRPELVLPFQKTKEDAVSAFLELCKGKPLLPWDFTASHRLEKITGIYVPFWLYDCQGTLDGRYKATRLRHWMDANYNYTRTEHYLLLRGADASFSHIPMDGSSKMDDTIMESIEPFDFSKMVSFDTAYLSGFFADRYDITAEQGHDRVRQRAGETLNQYVASSLASFTTAVPTSKNIQLTQGNVKYVLLPVWMLYTQYEGKTYLFAMNGQTGKMTGSFPVCPKRSLLWFGGIAAAVTAAAAVIQLLAL